MPEKDIDAIFAMEVLYTAFKLRIKDIDDMIEELGDSGAELLKTIFRYVSEKEDTKEKRDDLFSATQNFLEYAYELQELGLEAFIRSTQSQPNFSLKKINITNFTCMVDAIKHAPIDKVRLRALKAEMDAESAKYSAEDLAVKPMNKIEINTPKIIVTESEPDLDPDNLEPEQDDRYLTVKRSFHPKKAVSILHQAIEKFYDDNNQEGAWEESQRYMSDNPDEPLLTIADIRKSLNIREHKEAFVETFIVLYEKYMKNGSLTEENRYISDGLIRFIEKIYPFRNDPVAKDLLIKRSNPTYKYSMDELRTILNAVIYVPAPWLRDDILLHEVTNVFTRHYGVQACAAAAIKKRASSSGISDAALPPGPKVS